MAKEAFITTVEQGAGYAGCRVATPAGQRFYGGHSLRHSGIKAMARGGNSEPEIKAISRHSSDAVQGYIEEVAAVNTASVARRLTDGCKTSRPPVALPASAAEPWRSCRSYPGLVHLVVNEDPKEGSKIHGTTRPSECKCSYAPLAPFATQLHAFPATATAVNIWWVGLPEAWRRLMAEAARLRCYRWLPSVPASGRV